MEKLSISFNLCYVIVHNFYISIAERTVGKSAKYFVPVTAIDVRDVD